MKNRQPQVFDATLLEVLLGRVNCECNTMDILFIFNTEMYDSLVWFAAGKVHVFASCSRFNCGVQAFHATVGRVSEVA